ncbi:MAG: DUF1302 domain-containing protein [Gammaproteobacteria bacterium]|nr:DUF1302 domain-containing protein [Gammaproteobacteria bacterium]
MSRSFSRGAVSIVSALTVFCFPGGHDKAHAFEFDDGPIKGNIDTTLSYGTSTRLDRTNKDLVCIANGGTAFGCNADDGNLNYRTGTVSEVFKFTTDIEINHKTSDLGGFFRIKGFVDHENNSTNSTGRTPLTDDAIDLVGKDVDVLDAYVWKRFEVNNRSAEVRFGKHVLNWGESTFIQGGINALNPIDVAAIRLPGSELREALLPVNMISMSADITDNLSVEGFYQFEWEETSPDPSGSYFSTNDFGTEGGSRVQLGFGDFSDLGIAAGPIFSFGALGGLMTSAQLAGLDAAIALDVAAVPTAHHAYLDDGDFYGPSRAGDNKPKDDGQWGFSFRLFSEALNDTEFGFYFMNYHSRLPLVSAVSGTPAGVTAAATVAAQVGALNATGGYLFANLGLATTLAVLPSVASVVAVDQYVDTANYLIEYPEDIKLYGASFNTNAGQWALQGEVSHKQDAPLQIDDAEVLLAALTPLAALNPALNVNQVGTFGTNQYIRGYIERDVSQLQATATRIFPNIMGADEFTFVAEAAVTHVHDMPSKSTLRLEAPGTFTSGNTFHATTGLHAGKAAEDSDAFPDATSWGYRVAGRWTFNNAYKSLNLLPRVAFQHDVDGITPGPGGNFLEDRKAITLGLGANYKNQWAADLSYTDFYGAGRHNLLNDRDFLSFNLKYSF